MKTTEIESICPYCGYKADRASDPKGNAIPGPGDLSFCIKCGQASLWNDQMQLVKVSLRTLPPDIRRYVKQIRKAWLTLQEPN